MAGELYTSKESIDSQLAWTAKYTCPNIVETFPEIEWEGSCGEELSTPETWPAIAKVLLGSKDGWFKPESNCDDLECQFSEDDADEDLDSVEVSCKECVERMDGSLYAFKDAQIIGEIVYEMAFKTYCPAIFVKPGPGRTDCQKKVAAAFPRVMYGLSEYPEASLGHREFCVETVKCVQDNDATDMPDLELEIDYEEGSEESAESVEEE